MFSKQQMYYMIRDLHSVFHLSPYDLEIIIEMVLMFYTFTTEEKFKKDVWQFCQRLERS